MKRSCLGFTLAEVLVAFAILVIGVLAALRIFPSGFASIQNNRNRALATRLAEQEIQRWKANPARLPDAIVYSTNVVGMYALEFPVLYDPEDLTPDEDQPLWLPAGAGLPRTVIGEVIQIGQAPQRIEGADVVPVPLVTLALTPITHLHDNLTDWRLADPTRPEYQDPVVIYSGLYEPVEDIDALARPPGSQDREHYYIDYARGTISFDAVDRPRVFRVQYLWYDGNPANPQGPVLQREWLETIEVAANEDTVANPKELAAVHPASPGSQFQGVVWGSESVHLAFRRQADIAAVDAPDEYFVDVDALAQGRSDVAFYFPASQAGKRVHIDYRVRDWSILREEHTVPQDGKVKLALTHLKDPLYTNAPRQPAPMVIDGDAQAAVVALDVASGERFLGWEHPPSMTISPPRFQVDFRTGTLTFPPGASGRTFRIHYRAEDDWTLQVLKPYSEYDRSASGAPGFRSYAWDAAGTDEVRKEVAFAPADSGKSVSVDYVWVDGNGRRRQVSNELHRISKPFPPAASPLTRLIVLENPPAQYSFLQISGVSLRARVLWIARKAVLTVQGSRTDESWRQESVDTYLRRE